MNRDVAPRLPTPADVATEAMGGHKPHASPAVRRFACELGVDLAQVQGSGLNARITFDDVKQHVRGVMHKRRA